MIDKSENFLCRQNRSIYCPLCKENNKYFYTHNNFKYHRCLNCRGVFMDPADHLSPEKERERYLQHNNDVDDPRYQKFVMPVVNRVKERFGPEHSGLDFGSGTGPVITKLLRDGGYSIGTYDPFFCNEPELLNLQYDYIISCEVVEHFADPASEFKMLKSLLEPGGSLICMTAIYSESIDFAKWFYKHDPTHIFFYHKDSLEWIRKTFGFSSLTIEDRLIEFTLE